jgi:hypothetical protein
MVGLSFIVSGPSVGRALWSDAQAGEYQQAALRLHELSHAHGEAAENGAAEKIPTELAAAQARYDSIRSQLDGARHSPNQLATALRWAGVGSALVGLVVYFASGER